MTTTQNSLKSGNSHFFYHRDKIEQEIAKCISGFGEKTKLRDACEYALTNGGKRFRPLIVVMVAEALEHGLNVYPAALSVEFFHTASLIADDLPCMDNDDERRDKPSTHKVYGETIALLSSYAMITSAFEKIYANAKLMKDADTVFSAFSDQACVIALECATRCAGILGATGGQFLDLFPPVQSLDVLKSILYKKTVTLFEVSFVFGWVFGGGDFGRLEKVRKAAYHLGMAFQIADDLSDMAQDEKRENMMNMARFIGKEKALFVFDEEMRQFKESLSDLNLYTPSFAKMSDMLSQSALKNS